MSNFQSTTLSDVNWQEIRKFKDIKYHKSEGIAKITINRPEVRNAFRPLTVKEMMEALDEARNDQLIGVIILCGEGKEAFCSGGDQRIRGDAGYTDDLGIDRLNVLDFQRQIRSCPKPVVAMVAGFAIGGGHVLHVVCDLTICADNAIFGQVGPKVGSFDGGFGAGYFAARWSATQRTPESLRTGAPRQCQWPQARGYSRRTSNTPRSAIRKCHACRARPGCDQHRHQRSKHC